ncbi:MAG: xanthine dehydrogenase family protein molybdopterin-binding subunit [Acidobacteria bacterium]|nr:xanthine dehydrogenase family protein molybdopterin-binding subunit [Acidobacteriota bacterium]
MICNDVALEGVELEAALAEALNTPTGTADIPAWTDTKVVGQRLPKIDAYERVSGTAVYPSDITLPGMLHAAVLRCPHGHARVKKLDASRAAKMPGVRAVLTPESPGADIPWYPGEKGYVSRLLDTHCRFAGDEIAAVAADTPYQAFDAVRAIVVEYEVLPNVVGLDAALAPNAPAVLDGPTNRAGDPRAQGRGDVAAGFAAAEVTVEGTYSTGTQLHVPIELHGAVVRWDGPKLVAWDSLQGVFPAQNTYARALALPLSNVRVIGHYMGGGFGSKLDTGKYGVIAALLAKQAARPVRLFMTREDTMRAIGNRPAVRMTVKLGAKKDGTLTAIDFSCTGSGGAYSAGGTGGVNWLPLDLYRCPNVNTVSTNVYIHAGPERPFRGPGHPQGAWALEQAMDTLAAKLGMDPVALRLKNVPDISQGRQDQARYTSTGLATCLTEGAKTFGWTEARARVPQAGPVRRGVGVAAGMWRGGGGSPPATIIVRLVADGTASVNMGASDIGNGTKTWAAMIVAEELGVPVDRIGIEHADTATTQYTGASGGSKTVPTEAPAIRAAAIEVKRQLLALAAADLKVDATALSIADGAVFVTADPSKRIVIRQFRPLAQRGVLVGVGVRGPDTHGMAVNPWGVHFAEVEVDTRTGLVRIQRYLAAQDSGKVMNRLTYDNQVIGAITMGQGLALTEDRIMDAAHTGRVLNANMHDYKVPTALDAVVAPVIVAVDPKDTTCNIAATKGLGEPATIPAAAAIANAVAHALGVRVVDAPISPQRVLDALAAPRTPAKGVRS